MTPTKPFDPTKPYTTRDGRKVHQLTKFNISNSDYPYVGVIEGDNDLTTWTEEGTKFSTEYSPNDLVNVPQKIVGWVMTHQDEKLDWENMYKRASLNFSKALDINDILLKELERRRHTFYLDFLIFFLLGVILGAALVMWGFWK